VVLQDCVLLMSIQATQPHSPWKRWWCDRFRIFCSFSESLDQTHLA